MNITFLGCRQNYFLLHSLESCVVHPQLDDIFTQDLTVGYTSETGRGWDRRVRGRGGGGAIVTHMCLPLGRLPSHEGVGQAVLGATLPVAGLVVALKLAGAPTVVEGAAAASLLPQLHVIVDHLIWVCTKTQHRCVEVKRSWTSTRTRTCLWVIWYQMKKKKTEKKYYFMYLTVGVKRREI